MSVFANCNILTYYYIVNIYQRQHIIISKQFILTIYDKGSSPHVISWQAYTGQKYSIIKFALFIMVEIL